LVINSPPLRDCCCDVAVLILLKIIIDENYS
jgi:hypothetical protein